MAEQSPEPEVAEEGASSETEGAGRGPLIPASLVRWCIVGGVLAGLAVGALFLVTDVIAPRLRAMGDTPAEGDAAAHAEASHAKASHAKASHAKKSAGPGEVFAVNDLIVNPAGTGGRRYLKVAAAIEAHDPKVLRELELRQAQIRDLLIRELSARSLEELTDPVAKEEMRQTIIAEINGILAAGQVGSLFFTEYVVQ